MSTTPPKIDTSKVVIDTSDMDLPEGKVCNDCVFYNRCKGLFQCKPDAIKCDFAPSRFRQRVGYIGPIWAKP